MLDMELVAEGIYRLKAPIPGSDFTFLVYLMPQGGVLIEPGPSPTIPFIQRAMKQLNMSELAYIIPTHIHIDHGGAAGSLAKLFPEAKVVLHPSGARHAINPARLIESTRMAFGAGFDTVFGTILPVAESQVRIVEDGELIATADRELQIVYAPGHAMHQLAIFDRKTAGLFCGEALGMLFHGTEWVSLPAVAPPNFDVNAALNTIERLRELNPRWLFFSHYDDIDNMEISPRELMDKAAGSIRNIGDIILGALKRGEPAESVGQLVGDYISGYLGVRVSALDVRWIIEGFSTYFRKKRLV